MPCDLQENICANVSPKRNLVSWFVVWAATSFNMYNVDEAGITAFERVTGSTRKRPVAKFGGRLHFMQNGKRDAGFKETPMFMMVCFLGRENTALTPSLESQKALS